MNYRVAIYKMQTRPREKLNVVNVDLTCENENKLVQNKVNKVVEKERVYPKLSTKEFNVKFPIIIKKTETKHTISGKKFASEVKEKRPKAKDIEFFKNLNNDVKDLGKCWNFDILQQKSLQQKSQVQKIEIENFNKHKPSFRKVFSTPKIVCNKKKTFVAEQQQNLSLKGKAFDMTFGAKPKQGLYL